MHPFRFLAIAPGGFPDAATLTAAARRAESIGYSALVIPDHLIGQHAPLPALAVVAAATERLRIGTFVANVDLRHPAVLAQEAATLDVLSGGRLELGIGAGWNRPEYEAIGLRFDPPRVRIERLREAVAVLKGCFSGEPFSHAGEHYTVTDHVGVPAPVQRPHPPIFIGGGGKRTLTLAGEVADIVGLAPRPIHSAAGRPGAEPFSMTLAGTEEKLGWLRAAAGDRFDQLEINTYPSGGPALVTNDARAEAGRRADALSQLSGVEVSTADMLESPHVFIGSVDGLCAKMVELRDRFGISSFALDGIDELAPVVERLSGT